MTSVQRKSLSYFYFLLQNIPFFKLMLFFLESLKSHRSFQMNFESDLILKSFWKRFLQKTRGFVLFFNLWHLVLWMHSLIFTQGCRHCRRQAFCLPGRHCVPPLVGSPLPAQPLADPHLASAPENGEWNRVPGFIVGLASCTQRSALETRLPFGHNSQGLSFRTDQQYSLVQMHPR